MEDQFPPYKYSFSFLQDDKPLIVKGQRTRVGVGPAVGFIYRLSGVNQATLRVEVYDNDSGQQVEEISAIQFLIKYHSVVGGVGDVVMSTAKNNPLYSVQKLFVEKAWVTCYEPITGETYGQVQKGVPISSLVPCRLKEGFEPLEPQAEPEST